MCDGDRDEVVWTIRLRATGELVTARNGCAYYFSDEDDAVALRSRLGLDGTADVVYIRLAAELA